LWHGDGRGPEVCLIKNLVGRGVLQYAPTNQMSKYIQMKKTNLILTLLLLALVVACGNGEKKAYLAEVDGMINHLDSLKLIADANVLDSLPYIIERVKKNTKRFAESYSADTINLEVGEMINSYKDVRKVLSRNSGNLAKVRVSIPETLEKLEDLKSDISHGVGERDKYLEYILFEREKVRQMDTLLAIYLRTNKKYLDLYESLNVKVGNYIILHEGRQE
jgi:hypothetical protein